MTRFAKTTLAAAGMLMITGLASAQTRLRAEVPFAFRAGEKMMQPGTYFIDRVEGPAGNSLYRVLNTDLRESAVIMARAAYDPKKEWEADGLARLAFSCVADHCALSSLWEGQSRPAYRFGIPKAHDEVRMTYVVAQPVKAD